MVNTSYSNFTRLAAMLFILSIMSAFIPAVSLAQEPLRVRRNFFGMHNLKDGGVDFPTGMDWTAHLTGPGFVFDWVTDFVPWIEAAFTRGLVPCIRVQECNGGCTPNPGYAGNVASTILNYKLTHPQYADRIVYLQLWNEPGDPRDFVPMDVYADYLVNAYNAINNAEAAAAAQNPAVRDTLLVMTPGQNGPSGWEIAFNHNPNAKFAFDVWATHPYPESDPPWWNHHDGTAHPNAVKTIDSYVLDLDVVAKDHGSPARSRRGFPVMITETAYGDHLGISYEGYPKTTRQMAADYNVSAFGTFWYSWPEIVAVNPFILNNLSWAAFQWVQGGSSSGTDADGYLIPTSPHPQYTDVRNLRLNLESQGQLEPPRLTPYRGAVGAIEGTVRRADNLQAIKYATLFTDGYEFGNLTLFDGKYRIENVPVASYTLGCNKNGYLSQAKPATVLANQTTVVDFDLIYTGGDPMHFYFNDCIPGVYCGGSCSGCNLFASYHGITFTAPADMGFIKFCAAKPNVGGLQLTFTVIEGGTLNGPVVGSFDSYYLEPIFGGEMIGGEAPGLGIPVTPGQTYTIKIQRKDGQGVYLYASNTNPHPNVFSWVGDTVQTTWDLYGTINGNKPLVNVGPTETPTPAPPTNTPGGPTETPTRTPTATNTPDTPPPTPAIPNPSFELDLSGNWTIWMGAGSNTDPIERDFFASGLPDGVWALGVKGIGAGGKGAFQFVNNNWVEGRMYRLSARVKNLAGTGMDYSIGYALGNTGAAGSVSAIYGTPVSQPATWTQISVDFTYSGSAGVTIYLKAVNTGSSERSGFDQIQITDLGASSPTETPTITPAGATNTPAITPTPTQSGTPVVGCTIYTWNNGGDLSEVDSIVESSGGWGGAQTAVFTTGVVQSGHSALQSTQDYGASYWVWNFSGLTPNQPVNVSLDVNINCVSNDSWVEIFWGPGLHTAIEGKGVFGAFKAKWDTNGAGNGTSSNGWQTLSDVTSLADASGNFTVAVEFGHWSASIPTVSQYFDNLQVCTGGAATNTPAPTHTSGPTNTPGAPTSTPTFTSVPTITRTPTPSPTTGPTTPTPTCDGSGITWILTENGATDPITNGNWPQTTDDGTGGLNTITANLSGQTPSGDNVYMNLTITGTLKTKIRQNPSFLNGTGSTVRCVMRLNNGGNAGNYGFEHRDSFGTLEIGYVKNAGDNNGIVKLINGDGSSTTQMTVNNINAWHTYWFIHHTDGNVYFWLDPDGSDNSLATADLVKADGSTTGDQVTWGNESSGQVVNQDFDDVRWALGARLPSEYCGSAPTSTPAPSTATSTPTRTPTRTNTPSPTSTATAPPATFTPTNTLPPANTPTATPSRTATPSPVATVVVKLNPASVTLHHPPSAAAHPSATAAINIDIMSVTNLGAFQFEVAYNGSAIVVANMADVSMGPFLGSTGNTVIPVGPTINNPAGSVAYGAGTLAGNPGPNGDGTLARIIWSTQFVAQKTVIPMTLQNVQVADVLGSPIPASTMNGTVTVCFYADVDCDDDVDIADIQQVAGRWNVQSGNPAYAPQYDIDKDGDIDIVDIQIVAGRWNTFAPFAP